MKNTIYNTAANNRRHHEKYQNPQSTTHVHMLIISCVLILSAKLKSIRFCINNRRSCKDKKRNRFQKAPFYPMKNVLRWPC